MESKSAVTEGTLPLLRSRKTEDRIRGVNRLIRSRDPAAVGQLVNLLRDRSNYVASLAAEALANCAGFDECSAMRDCFFWLSEDGLQRDPGCHIRSHLAYAFGRLDYRTGIDALHAGARTVQIEFVGGKPFDTGAHLRANSCLALAALHAADAVTPIAYLLYETGCSSRNLSADAFRVPTDIRSKAVDALVMLGPDAALPLCLKLKFPGDEEAAVLQECMEGLIKLQHPEAAWLIEPYVEGADLALAVFAAISLARLHHSNALQHLLALAPKCDIELLEAALLAISSLGAENQAAARKVLRALPNPAHRNLVEEVLGADPPSRAQAPPKHDDPA